jgi:hypothetical protein
MKRIVSIQGTGIRDQGLEKLGAREREDREQGSAGME